MEDIEFNLRQVSPAFVGDHDSESADRGVRVPSLRGVLRFWFRALLGESVSLRELANAEGSQPPPADSAILQFPEGSRFQFSPLF